MNSKAANLTAVYGGGSCNTCHVMAQGQRDSNGNFGSNDPNGTYEQRNSNRANGSRTFNRTNVSNFNRTWGNSNRTFPRNSYGVLFENRPDHLTDPSAALMAIGEPESEMATPTETTTTSQGTPAAPGFGIIASLFVLFGIAIVARRHNK